MNNKGYKIIISLIFVCILSIVGYIIFSVINVNGTKATTKSDYKTYVLDNISFIDSENYNFTLNDEKLFICDQNANKYKMALSLSTIKANTIQKSQETFASNLFKEKFYVEKNYNYISDDYVYIGYVIDFDGEESLYFFVDLNENTTLTGTLILKDANDFNYENALDEVSKILSNSELINDTNSKLSVDSQTFSSNMPGYENGVNVIPYKFQ